MSELIGSIDGGFPMTVYDPATGEITMTAFLQFAGLTIEESVAMMQEHVPEGRAYITGAYDARAFYIVDGAAVAIPPRPAGVWATFSHALGAWQIDMEETRALTLMGITQRRADARKLFVTDIPGQDAVYMAKAQEAREFLPLYVSEELVDPTLWPLIASEIGSTADTYYEVAQTFANLNALWLQVAGAVDGACFRAADDARGANDPDAFATILATLDATIAAIAAQAGA